MTFFLQTSLSKRFAFIAFLSVNFGLTVKEISGPNETLNLYSDLSPNQCVIFLVLINFFRFFLFQVSLPRNQNLNAK